MDYLGDHVGIRISENHKECWVMFKRTTGWVQSTHRYLVEEIPMVDNPTKVLSSLDLACMILSDRNPEIRQQLREFTGKARPR
jgi:hypothetical protein